MLHIHNLPGLVVCVWRLTLYLLIILLRGGETSWEGHWGWHRFFHQWLRLQNLEVAMPAGHKLECISCTYVVVSKRSGVFVSIILRASHSASCFACEMRMWDMFCKQSSCIVSNLWILQELIPSVPPLWKLLYKMKLQIFLYTVGISAQWISHRNFE